MHRNARPHSSAALKQIRGWVTLCALFVACCGLTQAIVFACVAYTDMRFAEVRTVRPSDAPLRVVQTQGSSAAASETQEVRPGVRGLTPESRSTIETTRVRTGADVTLSIASGIACAGGVLGVVALCVLSLLGVVVAGGASVPGVERVVTAGVWSMVMALLVMPWGDVFPSLRVPGIFAGYLAMTQMIEGHVAAGGAVLGPMGALFQWIAAPLITGFVAIGVCLWFRAGVEQGVIVTSPSELDRAIDREASRLAKEGGASSAPRSVGALNRALGDTGMSATGRSATGKVAASPLEQAMERATATVDDLSREADGAQTAEATGKRGRSVVDSSF